MIFNLFMYFVVILSNNETLVKFSLGQEIGNDGFRFTSENFAFGRCCQNAEFTRVYQSLQNLQQIPRHPDWDQISKIHIHFQ